MPIRTVGHYLKKWGFTPQKPVKRSYERCSKRVQKWLDEEYPAIEKKAHKEGVEIHWGDETGMCNQDQVGRGYAPKGQTPLRERKGKKVKQWASKRAESIELHYLPSYSPDLNPDEYLNRDLKTELSKRPSGRKEGHFKSQAKTEMRRLQKSPDRVKKYFRSSSIKYAA